MSWKMLENDRPEMAAFGYERLHGKVAYLGTVKKNGSPRVHAMTPIIGEGHLFVFMEPTSPKGHDLERDGRYAMHCGVSDTSGESGEFVLTGRAQRVDDPELRALAVRLSPYAPAERYVLFEFEIEGADTTVYPEGKPVRESWRRGAERAGT